MTEKRGVFGMTIKIVSFTKHRLNKVIATRI